MFNMSRDGTKTEPQVPDGNRTHNDLVTRR